MFMITEQMDYTEKKLYLKPTTEIGPSQTYRIRITGVGAQVLRKESLQANIPRKSFAEGMDSELSLAGRPQGL